MEAFYKYSLMHALKEIQAAKSLKQRIFNEMVELLCVGATKNQMLKTLLPLLASQRFSWPRGEAYLAKTGIEVDSEELISLLYHWQISYAHKIYRRGQIRSVLSEKRGHLIHVFVDEATAPCGRKHGDTLIPSPDVVGQIPPCAKLNCCCSWALLNPPRNA